MNGKKPRVKKIPRPPVTAEDVSKTVRNESERARIPQASKEWTQRAATPRRELRPNQHKILLLALSLMRQISFEQGPRAKITEERMRKKAEESERIRKENAEMKARIAATSTGRDSKELDAEILALRKQKALERTEAKAAEEARLKEQNREKKARIKAAKSKTDHDLLDDMVDLDGDGVADCSAAELRKRQAAAGKQAREDVDKDHKKRASELKTMKQNTQAKVDADIDDDMVDTDGDGIADMTQGELRRQKAAEGEQKLQDRADAHKQNAAQLENMKTNAQSRTDHGADGEEAEPEGDNADSPADDNAGDAAGTADAEEGAAEGAE